MRIRRDRPSGLRTARQHVQHPVGQPGVLEEPRDEDTPGHRSERVGFEQHGVAQCQGGRQRAHREQERRVPGVDDTDDAERHPPRQTRSTGGLRVQNLTPRLGHESDGVRQLGEGGDDLVVALGGDAGRLADDPVAERIPVLTQDGGRAQQDLGAVGGNCRGPVPGRPCGSYAGLGDIRGGGDADFCQHVPRGRFDHLARAALGLAPPRAVDLPGPLGPVRPPLAVASHGCRPPSGVGVAVLP